MIFLLESDRELPELLLSWSEGEMVEVAKPVVVATSRFVLMAVVKSWPLLVKTDVKVVGTVCDATSAEVTVKSLERVDRLMVVEPRSTSAEDEVDLAEVLVAEVTTSEVMVDPDESVVVMGVVVRTTVDSTDCEVVSGVADDVSGVEDEVIGVGVALVVVCADEVSEVDIVVGVAVEVEVTPVPACRLFLGKTPSNIASGWIWAKPSKNAANIVKEGRGVTST